MNAYDIKPVNEPRRLVDDLIAVEPHHTVSV
jgi:hypothetical protein